VNRRFSLPFLVGLSFILWGSSARASFEFEGEGRAKVAGGNYTTARKRAILKAERDALRRALASLASPSELAAKEKAIQRAIFARHKVFVRNYRVIAEEQGKATLDLRLSVKVRMRRLSASLRKTLRTGRSKNRRGKSARKGEILVVKGVKGADDPKLGDKLLAVLCADLHLKEFSCQDFQGKPGDLKRWAKARAALAILEVRAVFSGAEGVRALGLLGAKMEVSLILRQVKGDVELLQKTYVGWGASSTRRAAQERALSDALNTLAPDVSLAFSSRWVEKAVGRDTRIIRISGVHSYARVEQLLRELGGLAVRLREIRLQRIAAGELFFEARSDLSARNLAQNLANAKFSSTRLKLQGRKGNVLRFQLEELVPETLPSAHPPPE
jgi:hypothetical protein